MGDNWSDRIEQFWATADDSDPDGMVSGMRTLIDERSTDDAEALYEWASVHDSVGREAEAIPLYRRALAAGLDGARHPQALIQLASSLRNVGQWQESIDILNSVPDNVVIGDAARAFLALALHDAGRHDDALRVALKALAPTLPRYGRSVNAYADELTR